MAKYCSIKGRIFLVYRKKNYGEFAPSHFEKMDVSIKFPEHFSAEYKKKLIISVDRACTIGNSLKKSMTIHTVEQAE